MPALLFRLRNVPDDEAEEVRAVLDDSHIDYYETSAGNWGISMPAIWVTDERDLQRGKELIGQYQLERQQRMRHLWHERRNNGQQPGIAAMIRRNPVQSILILLFCMFLVYVMVMPFVRLATSA